MDYSYQEWKKQISMYKNPMLILSFPAVQLIGKSVKQVVSNVDDCADLILAVKKKCPKQAAYIGLMDLSVEAETFGMPVAMEENEVPNVKGRMIVTMEDAENLPIPAITGSRCEMYVNAMKKVAQNDLESPLFAGVIGPFSLAGRLMDVSEIMMQCFMEPDLVHVVLKKVTKFIEDYIITLKQAGANGVILAEPLAGLLSPDLVETFSSCYLKEIVAKVQDENFSVIYHNCGSSVLHALASIYGIGCHGYHFGNAVELTKILEQTNKDTLIFGNVDPVHYFCEATIEEMDQKVQEMINTCGQYENWVLSSGCDIPCKAKWENIEQFFVSEEKWR